MTIFITIPWFHPAYKAGGPIQSVANLVNKYSNAKFYIFCGDTDLNATALQVQKGSWIRYNDHTAVWYANKEKRSEVLVKQIEYIKPDIVYIVGIFSWHFNMVPLLFCKAPQKIISVRGMLHPGALSQKRMKKKFFLSLWTFFDWHRKASFHATDETEKDYILERFGEEVEVHVAGNYARTFAQKSPLKKKGTIKLVSIALISPMKSHLLVLQSLVHAPALIEYNIYGPVKDMLYWQQCLEEMKQLPVNIAVKYHGEIEPHKIEEALHQSHVFILPSKSENFGHAIFEALSAGKPVITSTTTPWQKLEESKAGINVTLHVDSIAAAILHFSEMDNEEYKEWSDGAVAYAARSVDESKLHEQYAEMFNALP